MKLSKKLVGSLCAGLALVIVASATYAWFTSKDSVKNHFETSLIDNGSVKIVELFTPPTDWKPGQDVTKKVTVVNNGEIPVFVRVSFEEILDKLNMPAQKFDTEQTDPNYIAVTFNKTAYTNWAVVDNTMFPGGITGASGLTIKSKSVTDSVSGKIVYSFVIYKDGTNAQRITADFKVSDDGKSLAVSNVKYWYYTGRTSESAAWSKIKDNTGAEPAKLPSTPATSAITDQILLTYGTDLTTLTTNNWYYNSADGFFYYIGKLDPGTSTAELLSSVKLKESAGNEYAGMKYDLFVDMQAIQLTKDAIISSWGLTDNSDLVNKLVEDAGI